MTQIPQGNNMSLTVPKQVGNNQYLNYARVGGTDVTMRLVLS